jgi:hypothetical protein
VISVLVKFDSHLHLAPEERGFGVSAFTLCLAKWTKREPAREGAIFCPQCLALWAKQRTKGAQQQ